MAKRVIFSAWKPVRLSIEILTFLVSNLAPLGPGGREVIFSVWEPIRLPIEILTFLVSNLTHLGPGGQGVVSMSGSRGAMMPACIANMHAHMHCHAAKNNENH